MACLNVDRLLPKCDQIEIFCVENKIDVMAINETKLDAQITDSEIQLTGYHIVRKDRNKFGGGVCLFIKNHLNYKVRTDLMPEQLECIVIELFKPNSVSIFISTWYRPPNSPVELFDNFEFILEEIDATNSEIYILGDLNCDFKSENSDCCTKRLRELCELFNLSQLINEPTRVTSNSESLIDLCLTSALDNISAQGVIRTGLSDHDIVYMVRKLNHFRTNRHKFILKRCFNNFNQELFINDLKDAHWDFDQVDPNDQWEKWKALYISIVDKHAPLKRTRVKKKKSPWLTKDLVNLIRKRDLLKKNAIITKDAKDWIEFKKARNLLNNELKIQKSKYYKETCNNYKNNPSKLWHTINEVCCRKPKSTFIRQLEIDDRQVTDSSLIADAFNNHFATIGSKLADTIGSCTDANLTYRDYLPISDCVFNFEPVSPNRVLKLILKLSNKKATGLDGISGKLIKLSAPYIVLPISKLFNCSLRTGIFPDEWKSARVTPVFKNGSRSDLNNYRPISILPMIAKVFEKIIYDQLYKYLSINNLLSNCQSGFRALHSTVTSLLNSTDNWRFNIDRGKINGVVFVDLKKAFDTVNHAILIDKMKRYGLNELAIKFLRSYLNNRSQCCSVNNHLSRKLPCNCGVPQGSILGPLLFLVFINDLPNCFNTGSVAMYADDTTVTFSAENVRNVELQMNNDLACLNNWLIVNKLSLNISKTEFMIITTRQKRTFIDRVPNIYINNKEIRQVKSVKSLGVHIEENLSWSKHIVHIYKKVSPLLGLLRRIRNCVDFDTLITIYKALVQPHLDYACIVWDGLDKGLALKLQRLQNRAARIITRSNWEVRSSDILASLNWDTLEQRRYSLKKKFMIKTLNGKTPEYIQQIFERRVRSTSIELRDDENKLLVPFPKTDCFKQSLAYSGAVLWNNLPNRERNAKFFNHN